MICVLTLTDNALTSDGMKFIPLGLVLAFGFVGASAFAAMPRMDQPVVADVRAAFARIAAEGNRLGAWSGGQLPYPSYSLNPDHDIGDNHFQGVQRLRVGAYLVVSGSNIGKDGNPNRLQLPASDRWSELSPPQGDLIVLRLASGATPGPLGPNINAESLPAETAKIVARVPIRLPLSSGTTLWHPGGLSACGDILVVPVENYNAKHGEVCSQILFYDFSEPEMPRRLPVLIDRANATVKDKAGAAAMIRLGDGRFLVVSRTTTVVSFYVSRTSTLEDGFDLKPASVLDEKAVRAAPGLAFTKFGGSSINIIQQKDGKLFLVGFSRTKADEKTGAKERHTASLWTVEFPRGDFRAQPELTRVADRTFGGELLGDDGWGIFGAAAGMFVTDEGALAIYSTPRWQVRRVGEFTIKDLLAGRGIARSDELFLPAIELWPQP